jgi:hypothetical protein
MLHTPPDDEKIVGIPNCWIADDEKEPPPESAVYTYIGHF